jgi:hypothetical protein
VATAAFVGNLDPRRELSVIWKEAELLGEFLDSPASVSFTAAG